MNPILENILKNKPNYCHCLEVHNIDELNNIMEVLFEEFINNYKLDDIISFCTSFTIYSLSDDKEEEQKIYDFDLHQKIFHLSSVNVLKVQKFVKALQENKSALIFELFNSLSVEEFRYLDEKGYKFDES